jgi:hypothetical protein
MQGNLSDAALAAQRPAIDVRLDSRKLAIPSAHAPSPV